MDEPVTLAELIWAANRTMDMHWTRSPNAWQPGGCWQCTEDGCPQLEWAQTVLADVRNQLLG